MTYIPGNYREFERWYEERSPEWPEELRVAGAFAKGSLYMLANNPPSTINAIRENASLTPPGEGVWDHMMANLTNFTRLYAEWSKGR